VTEARESPGLDELAATLADRRAHSLAMGGDERVAQQMCGRGYEPDTLVAWPTAEISVMGPEGAVDIIFAKQIAAADDPAAARAQYAAAVRETIDPFIAASWAMVDDVIDPADTRRVIIDALEGAETKRQRRAWRKHGVPPV